MTFREWLRSACASLRGDPLRFDAPILPAPKRYRAKCGRCVCPRCQRQVAYSSVTQRTARHLCEGQVRQGPIGPSAPIIDMDKEDQ